MNQPLTEPGAHSRAVGPAPRLAAGAGHHFGGAQLGLAVVGKGVETAEQLDVLRRHGCDDHQVFYAGAASAQPDLSPHMAQALLARDVR